MVVGIKTAKQMKQQVKILHKLLMLCKVKSSSSSRLERWRRVGRGTEREEKGGVSQVSKVFPECWR